MAKETSYKDFAKIVSNVTGKTYTEKDVSNAAKKINSGGGGSSAPVTTAKPLTYAPGSLETMTVAQAKAAGREDEYNKLVAGYGPQSTTTLSTANVIDNKIPALNNGLTTIADGKGTQTDANGVTRLANGSVVQDTTGDTGTKNAGYTYRGVDGNLYNSESGEIVEGSANVNDINTQSDQDTQDLMDQMKAMTDANTASLIENIQAQYAQRKIQQQNSNNAQNASVTNALLMGGVTGQGSSSQYAPVSSAGIISAQEAYGIQKLASLDAEENGLIAEARAAQELANYKLMELKLAQVEAKRTEKLAYAKELNDNIIAANKAQRESMIQSSRESAIADLYTQMGKQGVTPNIGDMLFNLNYYEDGTPTGGNFTAKEIADALASITKKVGAVDTTGMTADLKEYYSIVNQGLPLPASVMAVAENARPYAYAQYKAAQTKKTSTTDKYNFANDDRGKLIATGLSNAEIEHLEEGINEYGAAEVLSKETGLTEAQKTVLTSIIAGKKDAEFITKDTITTLFADDVLRKAANEAGYNAGGEFMSRDYGVPDDQRDEYITDLMGSVDLYRKMGLSDKDILAKIETKVKDLAEAY
jgi:hypothetical protein